MQTELFGGGRVKRCVWCRLPHLNSEHCIPTAQCQSVPRHRHVRTLVLDLDDVLVHSDWSRARGWRTFKRPGAEDFLRTMSQFYEVVVYTSQLPTYADPILDRLDPQRYVAYRRASPAAMLLPGLCIVSWLLHVMSQVQQVATACMRRCSHS